MQGRNIPWLIAISMGFAASAAATLPETPRFRVLSLNDGLPSTSIVDLAQSPDGYLWIGTRNGVARFDGSSFHVFQSDPDDQHSLPHGDVAALHVDGLGRTWVSVDEFGVSRLELGSDQFNHVGGPGTPLGGSSVVDIESTSDGSTWFGALSDGLARLDRGGNWKWYGHKSSRGDSGELPGIIHAIEEDLQGNVWIGTSLGLFRWTGEKFLQVDTNTKAPSSVFMLHADEEGLWVGTTEGLRLRDSGDRLIVPQWQASLPSLLVFSTLLDRFGSRWVATRAGLVRVNNGIATQVALDGPASFGLGHGLLEDSDGGVWVAQHGVGLLQLPSRWRNFSTFASGVDPFSTSARWVRALAPARSGGVWIAGRGGGLDRFDPATGRIDRIVSEEALGECFALSVLERSDSSVWIGCMDSKLVRLDLKSGRLEAWNPNSRSNALRLGAVEGLHEDRDGNLWLEMGLHGFQVRGTAGDVLENISLDDDPLLKGAGFARLLTGPDGQVWTSGTDGLMRWKADVRRFESVPGTPHSLVYSFDFRTPEKIWMSRAGVLELYRWRGARLELIRRLTQKDGLPNLGIGALVADFKGGAWVATAHGLVQVPARDGEIRLLGTDDGIPNPEFDFQRPIIAPNGIVFAPTASHLVAFDTSSFSTSYSEPKVSLEASIRRDDKTLPLPLITHTQTLEPDDRDLRITARIHSLTSRNSRRYRFRLHGYDKSWIDDEEGERVFTRLEHGSYRLEVIAATASGNWSKPSTLKIVVLPAWWQTTWARLAFLLAGILTILSIASAYRAKLRRMSATKLLEERRAIAEQASQAKSRFLADLGHEIRTPMTGVLGMAELMHADAADDRQRGRIEAIQSAGQHLLVLLNDSLDLARIEAGRLELQDVSFDLPRLLADACALVRPQAETKGVKFELQLSSEIPRSVRGDPVRLRQILLNLGNNAAKFTTCGSIVVSARAKAQRIIVEVVDTGPGMDEMQISRVFGRFEQADGAITATRFGGSGLGLAICRELAQAMCGEIEVSSTPGLGSCFRVTLPLLTVELPDPQAYASLHVREPAIEAARVLVVEDDALVAEVVCALLANVGHTSLRAAHGLDALAAAADRRFDMVVMDLDLPGLDGFEVARLLRAHGITAPIIALTARADNEAETLARSAGMAGFLRKPVTGEMLAKMVALHARVAVPELA